MESKWKMQTYPFLYINFGKENNIPHLADISSMLSLLENNNFINRNNVM